MNACLYRRKIDPTGGCMDILGIGTDITECLRIARMIERYGELFINRVYTAEEIRYCQSRRQTTQHFAGRWAAKEAFSKAWGTGIGKLRFQDLEILNDRQGAPYFSRSPFAGKVWISISHAAGLVTASVILEENDES